VTQWKWILDFWRKKQEIWYFRRQRDLSRSTRPIITHAAVIRASWYSRPPATWFCYNDATSQNFGSSPRPYVLSIWLITTIPLYSLQYYSDIFSVTTFFKTVRMPDRDRKYLDTLIVIVSHSLRKKWFIFRISSMNFYF
jgi:hypothetical protein